MPCLNLVAWVAELCYTEDEGGLEAINSVSYASSGSAGMLGLIPPGTMRESMNLRWRRMRHTERLASLMQ